MSLQLRNRLLRLLIACAACFQRVQCTLRWKEIDHRWMPRVTRKQEKVIRTRLPTLQSGRACLGSLHTIREREITEKNATAREERSFSQFRQVSCLERDCLLVVLYQPFCAHFVAFQLLCQVPRSDFWVLEQRLWKCQFSFEKDAKKSDLRVIAPIFSELSCTSNVMLHA